MLAAWAHHAIGDQHQSPIAQPDRVPALAPCAVIEHRVEAERAPHRLRGQHRAPVPGSDRSHVLALDAIGVLVAMQQTPQLRQIEMRREQILATKIDNGAVLGFAGAVAIGFDEAHVFALDALADGCPHDPQEHSGAPGATCPCNVCEITLIRNTK